MRDLIKTWPGFMDRRKVIAIFTHPWPDFYFTLGRGKPKDAVDRLYFTHGGKILGSFKIDEIKRNDGSLPKLRSIEDQVSEWQIKPDHYVAICRAPFVRLTDRLYYPGFRGFRYFDVEAYRGSMDSKVRV